MPCRSDYMEPTAAERYTQNTANLLVYAGERLSVHIPRWVMDAARDTYGAPRRGDELTQMLCKLCNDMTPAEREDVIFNGADRNARRLADWWEEHQAVDRRREKQEKDEARGRELAEKILGALNARDRELLIKAIKIGGDH